MVAAKLNSCLRPRFTLKPSSLTDHIHSLFQSSPILTSLFRVSSLEVQWNQTLFQTQALSTARGKEDPQSHGGLVSSFLKL